MGRQKVGQSWLVGPGRLLCSSCELQELQTASPAGLWLSSTAAQEQLADTQQRWNRAAVQPAVWGEEKLLEHSVSLQYRRENLMCRAHSVCCCSSLREALTVLHCFCLSVDASQCTSCHCSGTGRVGLEMG